MKVLTWALFSLQDCLLIEKTLQGTHSEERVLWVLCWQQWFMALFLVEIRKPCIRAIFMPKTFYRTVQLPDSHKQSNNQNISDPTRLSHRKQSYQMRQQLSSRRTTSTNALHKTESRLLYCQKQEKRNTGAFGANFLCNALSLCLLNRPTLCFSTAFNALLERR